MGFFMYTVGLNYRTDRMTNYNWRSIAISKLSDVGVVFTRSPKDTVIQSLLSKHKINVIEILEKTNLCDEEKQMIRNKINRIDKKIEKLKTESDKKQLKQQLKEPQKKNKKKIEYYDGIIIKQKQTNKTKKQPIKHLEQKINVSINVDIKPIGYNQNSKKSEEINKDNFYDTWAWKDIRYQALHKCGRRCMSCGASPLKDNKVVLHVDHIKPFRKYPELALDINNLQVLCEDCNMGKGYWDETDFRTRAG